MSSAAKKSTTGPKNKATATTSVVGIADAAIAASLKGLKREGVQRFFRIYSPLNILMLAGRMLRQRAIRTLSFTGAAVWTVLMGSSDTLMGVLDTVTELPLDVVLPHLQKLSLAVGLMFPAGLLLTFSHNAIALNLERRAKMNNLILTGDYKKQQLVQPYLEQLWSEVYQHEMASDPDIPVLDQEEFSHRAHLAVISPQPQTLQEQRVGFPLSLVEAWSRRGLFTSEDFLGDLLEYHQALRDLRGLQYSGWQRELLGLVRGEPQASFWHSFTVKKFKLLLGRQMGRLNQHYSPADGMYFKAEHFVWPEPRLDQLTAERFGNAAANELQKQRHLLFRKVFGNDANQARLHIVWMFLADYRQAFKFRLQFDPQFILSGAAQAEVDQLKANYGTKLVSQRRLNKTLKQAKKARHTRGGWLAQGWLDSSDRRLTRACYVALHASLFGAKKIKADAFSAQQSHLSTAAWLAELRSNLPRVGRGLRKTREAHLLVRHQIACYQQIVIRQAEYELTANSPE